MVITGEVRRIDTETLFRLLKTTIMVLLPHLGFSTDEKSIPT